MNTVFAMVLPAVIAGAGEIKVQLPPGFEMIALTEDYDQDRRPRMNNCGEVAFTKQNESDLLWGEIFVYDNGHVNRITNNNEVDWQVDINDDSNLAWTRQPNPDDQLDSRIRLLIDGKETELGLGIDSRINNLSHVAFVRFGPASCLGPAMDIMYYDGKNVLQITNTTGDAHQVVWPNDNDELVWVKYNFCPNPWESDILFYANGSTSKITDDTAFEPGAPTLNNSGTLAWSENDAQYQNFIMVLEDGEYSMLTDWGGGPKLNNRGDIAIDRYLPESDTHYTVLYVKADDTFYPLSDGSVIVSPEDINDWGEVVLRVNYGIPHVDIGFLRRIRTGEADFDGDVDADDFASFESCFTGPGRVDGLCNCRFLDIDHDGDVDCADWSLFASAWTGPPAEVPEFLPCLIESCEADLNLDGAVNAADLAQVLGTWGSCPLRGCPSDFDADGDVDAADLANLLGHWGPCASPPVCHHDAVCDDGDPCTQDTCDEQAGCMNVPLEACCGNGVLEPGEQCDPPDGGECGDDCQLIPGPSNCCVVHPQPGCDDPACEAAVCDTDPFCCSGGWDDVCASTAGSICAVCG